MSDAKKKEILDREKDLDEDELDAVSGDDTCACPTAGSCADGWTEKSVQDLFKKE